MRYTDRGCSALQPGACSTFGLDDVLVEDIDQLVFASGFPVFGVVCSVVLQEGVVDALLVLQRQGFHVRQEFFGQLELMGTHPVGAQLQLALHAHEALILSVTDTDTVSRDAQLERRYYDTHTPGPWSNWTSL